MRDFSSVLGENCPDQMVLRIARTAAGGLLLIAGIAMLALPGPGWPFSPASSPGLGVRWTSSRTARAGSGANSRSRRRNEACHGAQDTGSRSPDHYRRHVEPRPASDARGRRPAVGRGLETQAADPSETGEKSGEEAVNSMPSSKPKPWAGFRSVLCPVDFSEHSRQALRYAEAMAGRSGGSLTATYANDPLLLAAAAAALHDRRVAKQSLKELEAFVDETL